MHGVPLSTNVSKVTTSPDVDDAHVSLHKSASEIIKIIRFTLALIFVYAFNINTWKVEMSQK